MATPGEFASKLQGSVYKSQAREIISNVMDFMEAESKADKFLIDCKKVRDRVKAATGASKSTQIKIKAEKRKILESGEGCSSFETPNKKRKRFKPITGLDDFDLGVVRRTINSFYLIEKCLPTVAKLRLKLQHELNFTGSKTSVRRIIRQMGYRWRKTKSNKSILMERHDIAYQRFVFLKKIQKFRLEGRPIVYSDESYIDSTHVSKKGWSDESNAGIATPLNKGNRLILLHAGGEMGFINNCLAVWQANHKSGDYHDNMNQTNYNKWLSEKLIINLPPKSVVIIDNASYHNVQIDKSPTSNSKKEDMQAWLREKNIPFSPDMLKVQLYELIKRNKPAFKRYVVDELLKSHGHEILRLPPYHPELNAIELIWADVKNWVAAHNVTFNISDVEFLVKKKFDNLSIDTWKNVCEHVKKVEGEFLSNVESLENAVESFIIDVGGESSEEDTCSDNSDAESDGSLTGIEPLQ